ncbi:putative sagittal suture morphogenesis [Trypoxylus dichotomus]
MMPYTEKEMPLKWVLMQDKDPKDTSRRAKNWLMQRRMEVLQWWMLSPNLNPIENLWTNFKEAVYNANPKTQQQLWGIVQAALYSIIPERCQHLAGRMHRRYAPVLRAEGYITNY